MKRLRRILVAGMVALLAAVVLSPAPAHAAKAPVYKAGCKTTVATFTLQEGITPTGMIEHRLYATKCWNTKGNLTSTNVISEVNVLWAGKAMGYEARGYRPIKRSSSNAAYSSWANDGRAQGCIPVLFWKLPLCGFTEDWTFNVNFYGPAYKGTKVSPTQAASFMYASRNYTNGLKVAKVTAINY